MGPSTPGEYSGFSEPRGTPPPGVRASWHFNLSRGEAVAWQRGMLDFVLLVPRERGARLQVGLPVLWPAKLQFRGHFLRAMESGRSLARQLEHLDDGTWQLRIPIATGRRTNREPAVHGLFPQASLHVMAPFPPA